ncbi:MAG TPA: hypothetical protein VF334_18260, partial [Polyangia bacterium]
RVIATAAPTTVALAPPAPASFAEAERASTLYPWRDGGRHPYPRCFVCGPEFGDGVLLGRLAAHVVERPRVVERCVAQGSALFSDDGALSAVARATWIVLKS